MGLDAWATASQLAGHRPLGGPLTDKQMKNPPRQPRVSYGPAEIGEKDVKSIWNC